MFFEDLTSGNWGNFCTQGGFRRKDARKFLSFGAPHAENLRKCRRKTLKFTILKWNLKISSQRPFFSPVALKSWNPLFFGRKIWNENLGWTFLGLRGKTIAEALFYKEGPATDRADNGDLRTFGVTIQVAGNDFSDRSPLLSLFGALAEAESTITRHSILTAPKCGFTAHGRALYFLIRTYKVLWIFCMLSNKSNLALKQHSR